MPAWSDNRLHTLTHTPKRYVVDSSLVAAALSAKAGTVIDDGDLLGRTLDTFVTAQLRSELAASGTRARRTPIRHQFSVVNDRRTETCEVNTVQLTKGGDI